MMDPSKCEWRKVQQFIRPRRHTNFFSKTIITKMNCILKEDNTVHMIRWTRRKMGTDDNKDLDTVEKEGYS